jgi:transposase-like protein
MEEQIKIKSTLPRCKYCNSRRTIKAGFYIKSENGKAVKIQKIFCKSCGRTFSLK